MIFFDSGRELSLAARILPVDTPDFRREAGWREALLCLLTGYRRGTHLLSAECSRTHRNNRGDTNTMFRKRFFLIACLALTLFGSLLAGCSPKEEAVSGGGEQAATDPNTSKTGGATGGAAPASSGK